MLLLRGASEAPWWLEATSQPSIRSTVDGSIPSEALYGDSLGLALAAHLAQKYSIPGLRMREHKGGMAPRSLRRVVECVD
jgi:hypothetical protein